MCVFSGIKYKNLPKIKDFQAVLCQRMRDSIYIFAFGENNGVAAVQPTASDSPPDCRI